jgi:hypothetical protein
MAGPHGGGTHTSHVWEVKDGGERPGSDGSIGGHATNVLKTSARPHLLKTPPPPNSAKLSHLGPILSHLGFRGNVPDPNYRKKVGVCGSGSHP